METVLLSLRIIRLSRSAIREAAAAVRAAAAATRREEGGRDDDSDDGDDRIGSNRVKKSVRRADTDSDSDFDL